MLIIAPGTNVLINGLQGFVLQVCLQKNHISYQISYWDSNTRKLEWFEEFEIELLKHTKTTKIGFKEN